MTILHLIRRSAFETNDFEQCLHILTQDDCLVLLDDGCYNLHHSLLNTAPCQTVMLNKHAQARGIKTEDSSSHVTLISMTTLVELTFTYNSVMTWQ